MDSKDTEVVSLGDFLRYTLRHWVTSVIIVILAVSGAITYVQVSPAQYQSSAKIIVLGDSQTLTRDIVLGNYVALMTSNRVLSRVEQKSGIDSTTIRNNLSVSRDKSNEIIDISYTSQESDRAAGVINNTIESFQEVVTEMYEVPKDGVNTLSAPIDSGKPVNKSYVTPVLMAFAGGLALALVISFLRFDADQTSAKKLQEQSEEEKRKQRRIARDAEAVRKQKVTTELKAIEAHRLELEARSAEAKHKISEFNLKKINAEVAKAEKLLKVAEAEKKIAETDAKKAKAIAETAELELETTINEININEEKQIARRQAAERRRAARAEARIASQTDIKVAQIRAQKRIEAEESSEIPPVDPPASSGSTKSSGYLSSDRSSLRPSRGLGMTITPPTQSAAITENNVSKA